MNQISYRPKTEKDNEWLEKFLSKEWGTPIIVYRGTEHNTLELPTILAEMNGQIVGVITYYINRDRCEIVSINSLKEGLGIGSNLIEEVKQIALDKGCKNLWLVATNDNIKALGFYQKRGFKIVKIYPEAVNKSRKLKPEIPEIEAHGIPMRDEIELEMEL